MTGEALGGGLFAQQQGAVVLDARVHARYSLMEDRAPAWPENDGYPKIYSKHSQFLKKWHCFPF